MHFKHLTIRKILLWRYILSWAFFQRLSQVQQAVVKAVSEQLTDKQQSLLQEEEQVALDDIVAKAAELVVQHTIDIPRVVVVPTGEVSYGYKPFTLDLSHLNLQPAERDIVIQSLEANEQETMTAQAGIAESCPENYIIHALVDYDDISYDEHADLIYELANQAVEHLRGYLSDDEVNNVLDGNRALLAKMIHTQMAENFWKEASDYVVKVSSGFTPLRPCAYIATKGQMVHNFRDTVMAKGKIKQMLFGHFNKCLYPIQKFDSDTERRFSVIVERDCEKWFKPAKGQFQIYYKSGIETPEYVPDFVVEMPDKVLMVETKSTQHRDDNGEWNKEILAKAVAGATWCENASQHLLANGGKEWKYLLIPHDEIKEHNVMESFVQRFTYAAG